MGVLEVVFLIECIIVLNHNYKFLVFTANGMLRFVVYAIVIIITIV